MRKNKLGTIVIAAVLVLLSVSTMSCSSMKKAPRERNETFIADVNAFDVEVFHLYTTLNMGKPKISDFSVYFAPRTNYLFINGRVGADQIRVGFDYKERQSITAAVNKYLVDYENGTIPNAKPSKKNAYSKGDVLIEWGMVGLSHEVDTTYITNAQYLEPDKPYFRIFFNSATEEGEEYVNSPRVSIFISPSQWEKIVEACNQERLVEMTDAILEEANAF